MKIEEYQKATQRTANKSLSKEQRIINALLGLGGEIGEITDLFKKHLFQGHNLNEFKLYEELGDVLYYFADLCELFEYNILSIAESNNKKLLLRYPNGFESDKSINRLK